MVDNAQRIAGLVAMTILSIFLIGLAESIGHIPFWIIVLAVLAMAWRGYCEEAFRKPGSHTDDT